MGLLSHKLTGLPSRPDPLPQHNLPYVIRTCLMGNGFKKRSNNFSSFRRESDAFGRFASVPRRPGLRSFPGNLFGAGTFFGKSSHLVQRRRRRGHPEPQDGAVACREERQQELGRPQSSSIEAVQSQKKARDVTTETVSGRVVVVVIVAVGSGICFRLPSFAKPSRSSSLRRVVEESNSGHAAADGEDEKQAHVRSCCRCRWRKKRGVSQSSSSPFFFIISII